MRITPWKSRSELEQLKQWLFVDATPASKKRAIQRIDAYLTRGPYLPHIIEYTVRLIQCQLNDNVEDEEEDNDEDVENLKWNYCMVLIRFVNGMLDPVQQGQFAIPLHKLAENIGLPSWFVELRHFSTHERELPSLEMLRLCCKEAIQWTWDNYWNNDEWEDEDDELEDENDTEETQDSQKKKRREEEEQIAKLETLFTEYLGLKKSLREKEYLWKRVGITKSAFGEQDLSQDRELMLLSDWLLQLKVMWKQDNKDTFVKFMMLHCDETLLEICLHSLETFEVRGMEWLIDNYDKKIRNEETNIGDRFTNYKKLLKFLKRYCSLIDGRKLLSNSLFASLVEKYDNYLVIYILQLLSGDNNETNGSSYSRKRKKANEIDAKKVVERILARGVKDVELELFNSRKRELTAEPVPEDSPALDILQDLQNLKSQFKRVKQESKHITNWQEVPDWEPKPFGVI